MVLDPIEQGQYPSDNPQDFQRSSALGTGTSRRSTSTWPWAVIPSGRGASPSRTPCTVAVISGRPGSRYRAVAGGPGSDSGRPEEAL